MISVKPRMLMHQYERSVILKSRKSRKFWSFAIWMVNDFVAKNLDGALAPRSEHKPPWISP